MQSVIVLLHADEIVSTQNIGLLKGSRFVGLHEYAIKSSGNASTKSGKLSALMNSPKEFDSTDALGNKTNTAACSHFVIIFSIIYIE